MRSLPCSEREGRNAIDEEAVMHAALAIARPTLIRPRVVKRRNWSIRGSWGTPACERHDGRARETGADLISKRGVRHWGLHQTLIEARSGDRRSLGSPERRAVGPPRPRNSSVPSCRPTQCERAPAYGRSQLARSSGEGQPTARG